MVYFILIPISLILISWGYQAHYLINTRISFSFNEEMEQFLPWAPILEEHAADADKRKPYTPGESIKHYIDIDNFSGFVNNGYIPHNLDSVISIYGSDFVYEQGILPWATKASFDSLTQCFGRRDWDKAVLFAADLGHYVADGHMPLHITANYNGDLTGNYGIHSRFESTMINTYIAQISYPGDSIFFVDSVQDFIFNYIYENYVYVDSIIAADNYAQNLAGNSSSAQYIEAMWQQSAHFTIPLFKKSSNVVASLIYTAWSLAGKPLIDNSGAGQLSGKNSIQVFPNPSKDVIHVYLGENSNDNTSLHLYNQHGQLMQDALSKNITFGTSGSQYTSKNLQSGIYLLVIEKDDEKICKKVVIL